MTNRLANIHRYSVVIISGLMCLVAACNSEYYNISGNEEFIGKCERSGGSVSLQLEKKEMDNAKRDYVCVCDKKECDPGVVCDEDTKQCLVECKSDSTCQNKESGVGYTKECQPDSNGVLKSISRACDNDNSCDEDEKKCGECRNGSTGCFNNETTKLGQKYTCKKGKREITETCEATSCNIAGECGECLEGYTECEDDNHLGVLKICKNGAFKHDSCESKSCNAAKDGCGECLNDSVICTNDSNQTGIMKKCVDGGYEEEPCNNGVSCNALLDNCGDCKNGEKICKNFEGEIGGILECKDGKFTIQSYCDNNNSCKNEKECGECRNGKTSCSGEEVGTLTTCMEGQNQSENCPGDSKCSNSSICETCGEDGKTSCSNDNNGVGQVKVCKSNKWEDMKSCNGAPCNWEGTDCGCKSGEKKCINERENGVLGEIGVLYTCKDGGEFSPQSCPNRSSCMNDNECGECQNDQHKCEEQSASGYKSGVVYTCINGKWADKTDCKNSCSGDVCGMCINGVTKCETDDESGVGALSQCIDGKMMGGYKCQNNASCLDDKSCGLCNKKDRKLKIMCSEPLNPKFVICNNGKSYEGECASLVMEDTISTQSTSFCTTVQNEQIVCYFAEADNRHYSCIEIDGEFFLFENVAYIKDVNYNSVAYTLSEYCPNGCNSFPCNVPEY